MSWHGIHIDLTDLLSLGIGVFGLLLAWAQSYNRLPKGVRDWLGKIGSDTIMAIIVKAESVATMSTEDRRKWAVEELKAVVLEKCGLKLPTSVANLLMEFVYQAWKKSRK